MIKLTKKEIEFINEIKDLEKELGCKLLIRHNNLTNKKQLLKVESFDIAINRFNYSVIIQKLNGRIINSLLDKDYFKPYIIDGLQVGCMI